MTFSFYWNSHQIPCSLIFGTWFFHGLIEKGKNLKHEFFFVLSYFLLYFLRSDFRRRSYPFSWRRLIFCTIGTLLDISMQIISFIIFVPPTVNNVHNLKWALNELLLNQAYLVSKIESYTSKDDGRLQARV